MVTGYIDADLRSYGSKILYVGDPGQLEPIENDIKIMSEPDFILDEIHRQARGSDIIDFSFKVRNGMSVFRPTQTKELLIGTRADFWDAAKKADMVIVGFNKTRHEVNRVLRRHKGFDYFVPEVGEPVICLRNNRDMGVYNGLTAQVIRTRGTAGDVYYIDIEDELGRQWKNLPTYIPQYGSDSLSNTFKDKEILLFDWAYGLTAHKSQGSEWKKG